MLVPVDMRHPDTCQKAIATAVWLARPASAAITILTVARPFGTHMTEMPEDKKPDFDSFVAAAATAHDYPIEALFRSHESVDHVIQDVVRKDDYDVVVMASHHPRLADHLFGSHASQAALHADATVLVVR